MRHVVVDPDGEVALRAAALQLVEDGLDHRRRHLLRRQPVTPADDPGRNAERRIVGVHRLGDRGDHLEVQRLADRARLLRTVEHRHGPDGGRQRRHELARGERMEQAESYHADALACRGERVDRLLDRARNRSHHHDDALGIDRAVVLDEPVPTTRTVGQLVHHLLDDRGHREVERVRGFPPLEEDVGILRGATNDGCLRGQPAGTLRHDVVVAHERAQILLAQHRDLVDLVRGPEPVEEVHERHP